MASKREKREKRRSARESTNRRLANHNQGFESTTVDLPKDVDRFSIKEAKPITGDILNYTVGKGNPYADEGELHWERTFYVHRNIGPDNKSYVCPGMASGGKVTWPGYSSGGTVSCPICREIIRLHNEDNEENKDLIKSLKLQERQLVNWKPIDSDSVQVWDFSHFPLGDLIDTELRDDPDEEYTDFSDWENGFSIRVIFEEASAGNGKTWFKPKSIKFKKRAEQYDADEIEKKVHCLDDFIKVLDPDQLKRIFLQSDANEESETNSNKNGNFKESDVKKIRNMTEKELKKFCAMNDIDLDFDDFETLDEAREAVVEIVQEAIEDKGSKKAAKKTAKKAKKVVVEDDDDEEDSESEDDDDDKDEDDDDDKDEDDDDEDEDADESDDEDEEDDDVPESDDDEDDEDSDDDDEDEDEDDEPPAKPAKKKTAKRGRK